MAVTSYSFKIVMWLLYNKLKVILIGSLIGCSIGFYIQLGDYKEDNSTKIIEDATHSNIIDADSSIVHIDNSSHTVQVIHSQPSNVNTQISKASSVHGDEVFTPLKNEMEKHQQSFPIQSLPKDMNEGNSWNLEIWEVPIKSRETFDVDSPPLFTIQCTKGTDLENLQRNKEVASYLKRRLAVRKSAFFYIPEDGNYDVECKN